MDEALYWGEAYRVQGRTRVLAMPALLSWPLVSVAGNSSGGGSLNPGFPGDWMWEGQ